MSEDWLKHLKATASKYPKKPPAFVLKEARETYQPTQQGEGVRDDIKRAVKVVRKVPEKIVKRVATAIQGRSRLPLKTRKILESNGDERIEEMRVHRRPILSLIEKAFRVFSGNFNEIKKNLGYDALQHLALFIKTQGGWFRAEKLGDDDIKITKVGGIPRDGESMEVPMGNLNITMNELMARTERLMGAKFLPYESQSNNCQVFVSSMLRSARLLTPDLSSFINQDIERLYKEVDNGNLLRKLAKGVTDIGGVVERAITGEGRNKYYFVV